MAFFPTGIYPNPRPPYHPQPGNPDNSGSEYVHSFRNSFEPAHWNSGKVMGAERSLCRPLGPQSCPSLWDPMDCSTPVFPAFIISQSLLIFMSIESLMPSNHLILCHPLLLPPSVFPSIRVFSSESALPIRWPKDWSFSFSISPSTEHPGLISFRMDWLGLLAVQGTLKRLLQHHHSTASILQRSAFYMVQRSHPYMTAGKIIAST